MDTIIIFCAQYLLYIAILVAFVYWIKLSRQDKVTVVVYGFVTGAVAYILAKIGAHLYYNPRPFMVNHVTPLFSHAAGNGFPSDHTLLTAAIAFALLRVSKKWGIAFMVIAVVIGSARVMANVHHPIDIIGSIIFAAIGYGVAVAVGPKLTQLIDKRFFGKKTKA